MNFPSFRSSRTLEFFGRLMFAYSLAGLTAARESHHQNVVMPTARLAAISDNASNLTRESVSRRLTGTFAEAKQQHRLL